MPKFHSATTDVDNYQPSQNIDDYLSYTCDVTDSMRNYAELTYKETPQLRMECIEELKQRLRNELNLDNLDGGFLLVFLRSRKFDVERAFNMIKRYYHFLYTHRHFFSKDNLSAAERLANSNIIGFLPYRDSQNRAIILVRTEKWDPDQFPLEEGICSGLVLLRSFLKMPANQIMGIVIILDCKGLSLKKILAISPKHALLITQGLQHCCPCKTNNLHILNASELFRLAFRVFKPLISEKIRHRIIIHGKDDYKGLHEYFPKIILPSELNGELGPFDNEHWVENIEKLQMEYNEEIVRCIKVKEEKSHTSN